MRMKQRISLTLDPKIARQGKLAAKRNNQSLSSLVEELLEARISGKAGKPKVGTFSERWTGKVGPALKDDDRYAKLKAKYLS